MDKLGERTLSKLCSLENNITLRNEEGDEGLINTLLRSASAQKEKIDEPLLSILPKSLSSTVDINLQITLRRTEADKFCKDGNKFFDDNDLPEAITAYSNAIKCFSNHIEALGNRANVNATLENWSLVIIDTSKIIKFYDNRNSNIKSSPQDKFNLSVTKCHKLLPVSKFKRKRACIAYMEAL